MEQRNLFQCIFSEETWVEERGGGRREEEDQDAHQHLHVPLAQVMEKVYHTFCLLM